MVACFTLWSAWMQRLVAFAWLSSWVNRVGQRFDFLSQSKNGFCFFLFQGKRVQKKNSCATRPVIFTLEKCGGWKKTVFSSLSNSFFFISQPCIQLPKNIWSFMHTAPVITLSPARVKTDLYWGAEMCFVWRSVSCAHGWTLKKTSTSITKNLNINFNLNLQRNPYFSNFQRGTSFCGSWPPEIRSERLFGRNESSDCDRGERSVNRQSTAKEQTPKLSKTSMTLLSMPCWRLIMCVSKMYVDGET